MMLLELHWIAGVGYESLAKTVLPFSNKIHDTSNHNVKINFISSYLLPFSLSRVKSKKNFCSVKEILVLSLDT